MKRQIAVVSGFLLLFLTLQVEAQVYHVSDQSNVMIFGSSSLHDWESEVEQVSGKGTFTVNGPDVKELKDLNVVFVVKSIESGKSKMNNLTYEALKAGEHPNIIFKVTEVTAINNNTIRAKGLLTIAGKTNPVEVNGSAKVSGNAVTISGEQKLNMTDYDVEPPTAMFGTIKVEEEVTIKYNLVLTR